MSSRQDIYAIRAERLTLTHDPLALMANTHTPFHPDQPSHITYVQHPQPNNNYVQQPLFHSNYIQQPMKKPEDISDSKTAFDMAMALMAKAFKLNDTTPTNNNQTIRLQGFRVCLMQYKMFGNQVVLNTVQNPGVQNVGHQNGLSVVPGSANQNGNGNVAAARAEGDGNGINENLIRCYNYQGVDHYASNCLVKPWKRDVAYLQIPMQIAQKEEAGI
ncbi:hypothetical protein Tco_0969191 [Tanacetum coccineum]